MHHSHDTSESSTIEYLKFSGVIAFIIVITLVSYWSGDTDGWKDFARLFMGFFMVVFASFKLVGYSMFASMFKGYDPIAKVIPGYALAYPFIELFLGLLALFGELDTLRHLLVVVLMGIGSVGVIREIYFKRSGVHCACLGNIIKLPLSTVSLVEDLAMVLLAVLLLVFT
jgi:hypothetical protein